MQVVDAPALFCPALALRISLAEAGLLNEGQPDAHSLGVSRRSLAQAVHQGDRLLRTGRAVLQEHALTYGDHCSLWVADGSDMIAVLCERPAQWLPTPASDFAVGKRLAQSDGVWGRSLTAAAGQTTAGKVQPGSRSSLPALPDSQAFEGSVQDLGPEGVWVASAVPWPSFRFMLATIDRSAVGKTAFARANHEMRQVKRHQALAQCLAWGLDAVQG